MKKNVFMTQTAEELAASLIGDLGHGPATEHGDRTSGYFVLLQAVDNEEQQVTVSITEVKNDIEGDPYYCIHCVDDVTPADCDLFYTRNLTTEALASTLKVIAGEFRLANRPEKKEEPKGDPYKVEQLTVALDYAAEHEGQFYGAYLKFTCPGCKTLTIDEGGLRALRQYYETHPTVFDD